MNRELEDLEKEFILKEDMEHEDIKELTTRILNLCKIDTNGFVIIQKSHFTISQKIMLVLSARYLACKLQQKLGRESSISETCKTKELASMLREKDTVVAARLKDLKDANRAISTDRGVFKIAPYKIDEILTELEGAKN